MWNLKIILKEKSLKVLLNSTYKTDTILPSGVLKTAGLSIFFTPFFFHTDYIGSIHTLTDTSGQFVEEYSFDAWGRRRNPTDWSYNVAFAGNILTRGYTGHEHLDIFGLIHMNGRVYDPVIGRFLSPDNYVQMPDFSQNFNRYSYCFNNPLVYVDPDGEIAWFVPIITGAAIFGTGNLAAHAIKGDVNSFGDGLKYFGQGALAGAALGAAWQFAPLIPKIGQGLQTGMTIYGKVHMWGTAVSAGSGLLQGAFTGDWSALGNAGEIFLGNFYLDENRNVLGGAWQGISRHTWELLQTGLGHTWTQLRNTFGRVDRIDYLGGATIHLAKVLDEIKAQSEEENVYSNASEHYAIITKGENHVFIDRAGNWNKFLEIKKVLDIEQHPRKF